MTNTLRFATLLACLIYAVSCGHSLVSAAEPVAVTAEMSLADYARHAEGKEFYGLYLAGQKSGWMLTESRVTEFDGKPVYEDVTEFHLVLQILGQRTESVSKTVLRYALDGDGPILRVEETEVEDEAKIERTAVRDGDKLRITTTQDGEVTERVVPVPRDTLKSSQDAEVWLAKPPLAGETFKLYEVSLAEDEVDGELSVEFLESVQLVRGGVPVTASRVVVDMDGGKSEMIILPTGRLLRGTLGPLLEIRAEEEEIAKALGQEPVDMLAASAIKVAEPLGDGETISKLTLELSGLNDFQIPESARQRVLPMAGGRAVLELVREEDKPEAKPLSAKERSRLLRATPSVQSDDEQVQKLAAEIVGDEKDPVKISQKLVDWIDVNLRPTYAANASTATAVLAQRAGDCTEHALLFTALARAAGVPARQLGGVVYTDEPSPLFAWHAWAEIHDGQGWVSVDPMWKQVRIDPTHIQFSIDDGEDAAWINILGTVKIDVKHVERVQE